MFLSNELLFCTGLKTALTWVLHIYSVVTCHRIMQQGSIMVSFMLTG
jgi:hypothetical protein